MSFKINVDVSDSLDPVSRDEVNVILTNENGEISGKSKVVSKKDGIYGVRFMCKLNYEIIYGPKTVSGPS